MDDEILWNEQTQKQFKQLIGKIPIFIRGMAEKNVSKKAKELVNKNNRKIIEEKDLVDAFFIETPFGFQGPLKCDMEEFGIDYQKYGYER